MSKTGAILAGVGATAVVGAGGGLLAYNYLSQPNNSNTNSNIAATNSNTKATKSTKSALPGTWVKTDDSKTKIEFTADEMIGTSDQGSEKGKYKIFCGQFMEVKAGESDAVYISKFAIEGDELTIFGKTEDRNRKYKRESSNTAANTSDSKTEEVTLNGKDLVGTWNDTEKPEFKYVFTEDQLTAYNNDEEVDKQTYKLPCGQILESTTERGSVHFSKVTIEGGEMTLERNGQKSKLRREGGNAANETADENLTEKINVSRDKLTGTWKDGSYKYIFTNDGKFLKYDNDGNLWNYYYYRFIDDQTVEWNNNNRVGDSFDIAGAKMTFKDDNKTLVWEVWDRHEGNTISNLSLESENADVNLGDSLQNNMIGNWVGIAGTNSADERISIFIRYGSSHWSNLRYKTYGVFSVGSDGTVEVLATIGRNYVTYKVTVADDVMTTEVDGVVKKYNRLKTVVDE